LMLDAFRAAKAKQAQQPCKSNPSVVHLMVRFRTGIVGVGLLGLTEGGRSGQEEQEEQRWNHFHKCLVTHRECSGKL
jgi:hypothetical protein